MIPRECSCRMMAAMRIACLLIVCAVAFAAESALQRTTFEDQPGFVLSNGALEMIVFEQGATFANLTLKADSEKLSPLWNPARLARESGQPSPFGASFGHFVCVDGFGPVSREE